MAKVVNGYKVVRVRKRDGREQFLSAAVLDPEWVVAYTPGIPTYARGKSWLFGFDSLAHAKRFVRFFPSSRIWEARLVRPRARKRVARWATHYGRFWAGKRDSPGSAPVGTLGCESITLLKQVA